MFRYRSVHETRKLGHKAKVTTVVSGREKFPIAVNSVAQPFSGWSLAAICLTDVYQLITCTSTMLRPSVWFILCFIASVDLQEVVDGECCTNDVQETQAPEVAEPDIQEIGLEAACPELSGQIIGGRPSSVARHPYQVSMVINGNSFCGGFIISNEYVITAAHCVRNAAPSAIRLRVGSTRRDSGGRIVAVSNVTVHPQYGRPQFDNDIAVLRLARPLVFSNSISSIRLPQPRQAVPLVRLTVTGWGLTALGGRRIPRTMMEAHVPVVPHWLCRLSYGEALTGNMFCGGHFLIGGVSSCQGDSGGPAVFRGVAFGVVSFARGCALPLSPTVFTNIASLRDWVTENTGV
ncbi:trypsin-like [Epargyreus clarus]|uniref:trypsin-like n=1 Tax=Epargyreus clarus TaxID=520877 RepID=UPI003C2AFA05